MDSGGLLRFHFADSYDVSSLYVVIECDALAPPDDGTVATPEGIGIGSEAMYNCNQDFYLDGEPERTCQDDGQWTGAAPVCRSKYCINVRQSHNAQMHK